MRLFNRIGSESENTPDHLVGTSERTTSHTSRGPRLIATEVPGSDEPDCGIELLPVNGRQR